MFLLLCFVSVQLMWQLIGDNYATNSVASTAATATTTTDYSVAYDTTSTFNAPSYYSDNDTVVTGVPGVHAFSKELAELQRLGHQLPINDILQWIPVGGAITLAVASFAMAFAHVLVTDRSKKPVYFFSIQTTLTFGVLVLAATRYWRMPFGDSYDFAFKLGSVLLLLFAVKYDGFIVEAWQQLGNGAATHPIGKSTASVVEFKSSKSMENGVVDDVVE